MGLNRILTLCNKLTNNMRSKFPPPLIYKTSWQVLNVLALKMTGAFTNHILHNTQLYNHKSYLNTFRRSLLQIKKMGERLFYVNFKCNFVTESLVGVPQY